MRSVIALVAVLGLAACHQSSPPAPEPSTQPTAEPLAPLESLNGTYDLVGLDGRDFDEGYGITLTITGKRIDFPNCKQIGWTYTFKDGMLETKRSPPGGPDAKPCGLKLPVRTLQMVSAIDASDKAERGEGDQIVLKGDLRSLTLAPKAADASAQ